MIRLGKLVLWLLGILVVFLLVLGIVLYFYLGSIAKTAIETVGPKLTGAPVTVASIQFAPLRGKMVIHDFKLGNPPGFKTDSAVKVKTVRVSIRTKSVFSDRIIIDEVFVEAPEITYEQGFSGNNISQIQKNLEQFAGGQKTAPETTPATKSAGKKIQINDFLVQDAKVNLSATLLGGHALSLPLPTVHLTGIGAEKEGKSVSEVMKDIFGAILKGVTETVTAGGKVLGDGVKALGGTAVDAGKTVTGGASKLFKGVGGLLGGGTKDK